jgi:prepilin-type N-terminal cleavage/methylation domain-containing protein
MQARAGRPRVGSTSGFTVIEVLVATSVASVVALGLAQLFVMARHATTAARVSTMATSLGVQKMEQLRALSWGYGEAPGGVDAGVGGTVSDTSTDLSVDPPAPGGSGLGRTPPEGLLRNSPPSVDYLDARGRWVGAGAQPPTNTMYVRRWSVEPLPARPDATLVLQVVVTTLNAEERRVDPGRSPGDVWLVSVKTRKAR